MSKEIKLKILQTIQKNFEVMGFTLNQQQNNPRHLSAGQIISVIMCSINIILVGIHIIRVADDIEDYMDSIFTLTILFAFAIAFISIIFKNDQLFNTIEICTNELNVRK